MKATTLIQRHFAELESRTSEVLHDLQTQALARVLDYAAATVPFYRERIEAARSSLGADAGARDLLAALPVLTRTQLQAQGDALLTRLGRGPDVLRFVTSGSSGMPVRVTWDREANGVLSVLMWRHHRWHGSRPDARHATIQLMPRDAGGQVMTPSQMQWCPGAEVRPGVALDSATPVDRQIDWLVEQDPHYLMTYPSNALALLQRASERGVVLPSLERIDTYGESLPETLPDLAQRVWGASLVDRYATREVGIIALACPHGAGYRVQVENVLVEVLDDAGSPVGPGETGQVVVTQLQNLAMPLIRYALGDYAEPGGVDNGPLPYPVLRRIRGRQRNMYVLPDGDRLWPRFAIALADLDLLRQFQVVQRRLDRVELNAVPTQALDANDRARLEAVIRDNLPGDYAFGLNVLEEIPRGPGGKFEDFRSEVA